jgi:hypothetical protein
MPGLSATSLSVTRILTMKFVTSSETVPDAAEVPLAVPPALAAEAASSRTTPLNVRAG